MRTPGTRPNYFFFTGDTKVRLRIDLDETGRPQVLFEPVAGDALVNVQVLRMPAIRMPGASGIEVSAAHGSVDQIVGKAENAEMRRTRL